MPLNANHPAYRAERTPSSITVFGTAVRGYYGAPPGAFGAKGNLIHYSGYHRSRRWLLESPDSRYRGRDYSLLQPLDQGGDDNDISAFDITPAGWGTRENRDRMVELTRRMHTAAKARDPRLSTLREFAGTLDGKNVVTFNCADGSFKTPFDVSHLEHGHGSFWRVRAARSHAGVLSVITGRNEEDMALNADEARKLQNIHRLVLAIARGHDIATDVVESGYSDAAGRAEVQVSGVLRDTYATVRNLSLGGINLDALADAVAARVVAAPNLLTDADLPSIRGEVKRALREGVGESAPTGPIILP